MTSNSASFQASEPGDDLVGPPGETAADLADALSSGGAEKVPGVPAAAGDAGPEPVYHAVEDWVIDHFLPMFRRTLGGEFRWCAQWWKHGEAISRLTALWHAWEVLRLQPGTGMATWYRDHLDHQLPILMGARGPFYQCSETTHREPHEAATTPAPGDWWDLADAGGLPHLLTTSPASSDDNGSGAGDDSI